MIGRIVLDIVGRVDRAHRRVRVLTQYDDSGRVVADRTGAWTRIVSRCGMAGYFVVGSPEVRIRMDMAAADSWIRMVLIVVDMAGSVEL